MKVNEILKEQDLRAEMTKALASGKKELKKILAELDIKDYNFMTGYCWHLAYVVGLFMAKRDINPYFEADDGHCAVSGGDVPLTIYADGNGLHDEEPFMGRVKKQWSTGAGMIKGVLKYKHQLTAEQIKALEHLLTIKKL